MGLVQIEDRGAVRHVVMTRAEKRNAMNGEMVLALGDAFREAAHDDSVRIVVVRGDGPMFSSGMDLGSLADLSADPSGLRPFRAEVLRAITLKEDRFGFEAEVTAKVARRRWRIYEVPISYHGRTYAEGKKITWKDGFRAVGVLVATRFSR